MPSVRKAKQITNPNDVEFLLNLTEEDLLKQSTVMEMFADFSGNDKPRFHPYDTVTIPPGSYQISSKNKKDGEKLYLRMLLATDYISGMTDHYAKMLYQEFNGIF